MNQELPTEPKSTFIVPIPHDCGDAHLYVSGFATADIECVVHGTNAYVTARSNTFNCPTATQI